MKALIEPQDICASVAAVLFAGEEFAALDLVPAVVSRARRRTLAPRRQPQSSRTFRPSTQISLPWWIGGKVDGSFSQKTTSSSFLATWWRSRNNFRTECLLDEPRDGVRASTFAVHPLAW